MHTRILHPEDHRLATVEALILAGLSADEADAVEQARWPMTSAAALEACRACGRALDAEDLTRFLKSYAGGDTFALTGEPIEADAILWPRHLVGKAVAWAAGAGVGEATPPSLALPAVFTVASMLDGLRRDDLAARVIAGSFLAKSLGAGLALAGERREDVEYLLSPQLSALLVKAMEGDPAAVDELAWIVKPLSTVTLPAPVEAN